MPGIDVRNMPLTVLGESTRDHVNIAFSSPYAMSCKLAIYDIMGREVHEQILNTRGGYETCSITGLSLSPGMYFLKMGNELKYGATKVIIP